jgi:sortase A
VFEHVTLGDVFTVESSDKRLINYRVSDISIVDETDNSAYEFSDDTLLTLITCYPFTLSTNSSDKTQRQIVKARAVYHSLQ